MSVACRSRQQNDVYILSENVHYVDEVGCGQLGRAKCRINLNETLRRDGSECGA